MRKQASSGHSGQLDRRRSLLGALTTTAPGPSSLLTGCVPAHAFLATEAIKRGVGGVLTSQECLQHYFGALWRRRSGSGRVR